MLNSVECTEPAAERAPQAVTDWLAERACKEPWLTVEIGHGRLPLARYESYSGPRYYVGVESWRNPGHEVEFYEDVHRTFECSHHAAFIGLGADCCYLTERPETAGTIWYPARKPCVIPDGVADEVLVKNVLNDPKSDPRAVIREATRMTVPGGRLIVFADQTPEEFQYPHTLARNIGFYEDAFLYGRDAGFEELQKVYDPLCGPSYPDDYVLILRKPDDSQ